MKKKILFVCMGNICRSPAAEGILKNLVEHNNISHLFEIDSAGTINYHEGELPDSRMRAHAQRRGYILDSRSRQILPEDGEYFDYIICMDINNYNNLRNIISKEHHHKIEMMNNFSSSYKGQDVPDPYYGGEKGFELVLDMLEEGCEGIIKSEYK